MSDMPLHLFPAYKAKRSILFYFTLNFSIADDKEFQLGLGSGFDLITGTCTAVLIYFVFKFLEGVPCW